MAFYFLYLVFMRSDIKYLKNRLLRQVLNTIHFVDVFTTFKKKKQTEILFTTLDNGL